MYQVTFPYCVYVASNREINCACDEWEADDQELATFPGFVKLKPRPGL
jgi:hypothetical protein